MRKFRDLPPEQLGVRVQSPDEDSGIVAVWAVKARGEKGQVKRTIVRWLWIGRVNTLPHGNVIQKSGIASHRQQTAHTDEKMLALLHNMLEPKLQRGLVIGDRGFETKLIGWVEAKNQSGG